MSSVEKPNRPALVPARPAAAASPELAQPDLVPDLVPLAAFIGTWRGEGRGTYPTITEFGYGEETRIRAAGGILAYEQRTWSLDDGRSLHAETGFWRPAPDGRIEMLIAEATRSATS